ncbi:putative formamidopyrimidine DNA glycosylase [Scheffersomyces coipomensis]|uniref:putative formamidopyrimidine DNA glycosylase n=1 Tax=Scheffersomyces coipomensis TaxID=1788519 RepID=UPI00315C7EE9
MPEVSEVAHVCALLRRNVLGYKIAKVNLHNDNLLFPALKNATDPEGELQKLTNNLTNSVIDSIGRHGKYFWIRLKLANEPKKTGVFLMHFGMTGMIKIKNVKSHMIFMESGGDVKVLDKLNKAKETGTESKYFKKEETEEEVVEEEEEEVVTEWPPRFSKMELVLEKDDSKLDLAFIDARRLGRIRLLLGDEYQTNESLLTQSPLNALGPDYSKPLAYDAKKDKEFIWGDPAPDNYGRPILPLVDFNQLILKKKVPIKSLLLDQAYFAGIGNWVGDEVCYNARIHPTEVISNKIVSNDDKTIIDPIIERLYNSIIYVCQYSVKVEGEVTKFPNDWLMIFRWGKARKKGPKVKTSEGYGVDYVTIGGRTSCFVPDLQKPLKKQVKEESETSGGGSDSKRKRGDATSKSPAKRTSKRVKKE